ncbi:DUF4040 domain-containing protein [Aquihabitans sp. G128]|uniref:hydrogen gas-evolving membrane-bound hydrogenase subunit E n=1 Tax=Aquihabitans sp. G128 TaxID=2849779 RepID=UPI001C22C236|nr:hydrogen gas-evolving membrane-bound hydrogenase subunit E [Aquihabitans sp. G128]QXC59169.1 DUF4040 domain-containing protein [Aquihabitans sp. G128]
MIALLALHGVVGVVLVALGGRLGRRGAWLAALVPAATVAWLAGQLGPVLDGRAVTSHVRWLPGLGVDLDLRLDGLAALLLVLVSGIGVAVFAYAARYLPAEGPGVGRLVGLLLLFSGAMVGLVLADDLLVLYGFWELTSVTSFLLIGNDHRKAEARAAALHALLVTGAGALAMLGGFLLLGHEAGTYRISAIVASPPTGPVVGVALALILLGAFTKSAQYPFHSWLPGAMVAPTPVSAYLHSATMVKAGVYLIARLSPAFAADVSWWRPVVVSVGLVTMLGGGLRALRQHDLKVLLAHSTVSQLGFLVAVFGIGTPAAVAAGSTLLLAHGAFKATGFLVVGIVDHQTGTRDLRCIPRLDRTWAPTLVAGTVAAASMAGIPLTLGFVAKESVLEAFLHAGPGPWALAVGGVVAGSALTAAYSARFAWGLSGRGATAPFDVVPAAVRPAPGFVAPAAVLAAATVLLGVVPGVADRLVGAHLAVWHGANAALGLSAVAIASGAALFVLRRRVGRALATGRNLPDGGRAYVGALRGLNVLADRVTAIAQPGSLPIYAGVILLTAAVLPLWALTTGASWPGLPRWVETPAHVPVAIVLVGAALAASVVRRRFSAALFLGVAGYAMAALFVVQGAPDLALTQVAIETLSTVLFVLVLRRLPDRFGWAGGAAAGSGDPADGTTPHDSRMTGRQRALRVGVAVAVAGSVFVLALVMAAPEHPTPTTEQVVARAEPDGHGRNVVNVILVDFRGFDTLGEIFVLASAAIGTVALARAGRRPGTASSPSAASTAAATGPPGRGGDGEPGDRTAPAIRLGRLVTLDVSVRVVFAAVMVGSVYLLFAGHNQPGGGFVGGILAGAAVALRYVAGGIGDVRRLSRARPWTVLGAGLVTSVGTAVAPLLLGDPVLSSAYRKVDLPVLGSVSLSSAAIFDIGVYLVVLGLALMVFESFGDDPVDEAFEPPVSPTGEVPVGADPIDVVGATALGQQAPS